MSDYGSLKKIIDGYFLKIMWILQKEARSLIYIYAIGNAHVYYENV